MIGADRVQRLSHVLARNGDVFARSGTIELPSVHAPHVGVEDAEVGRAFRFIGAGQFSALVAEIGGPKSDLSAVRW